jgi:hypothetical protein
MNRYVIQSFPYDPCIGGIKVLHYLAALLSGCRLPVATTATCFFDPLVPVVEVCDRDDIAVYPEVTQGNPLRAARIVRYMLYFPRYPEFRILKSECPLVYKPEYLQACRAICESPIPEDDILKVPNISDSQWCFLETKVIQNVLYIGKKSCLEFPGIPYSTIPDYADRWQQRHATLSILRKALNYYTLDHHTITDEEAALCGCRVYHVHGRNDFREQHPDPTDLIMRPQTDRALAFKFHNIVKRFFNL